LGDNRHWGSGGLHSEVKFRQQIVNIAWVGGEGNMRQRALQVVLVVVGLLFVAAVYPLTMFFSRDPALAMMLSLYVALGIFLLLAARNPSAHRSLISFTAWSSFAHALVMGTQAYRKIIGRQELIGVAVFAVIGVVLIALATAQKSGERTSAAGA